MKQISRYLAIMASLLLLNVAVCPSFAQDKDANRSVVEVSSAEVVEERDPFWPVGYWPKPEEPEVVEQEKKDGWMIEGNFSEAEKRYIAEKLKLRGVMQRGKKNFAVLANRLAGVGDVLSVTVGSQVFELELTRFDGKTVVLAPAHEKKENDLEETAEEVDEKKASSLPSFRALP